MSKEIFNPSSPPETLPDDVAISIETTQQGWNIFRLWSRDAPPRQHVLYFHGGAFVWHMLDRHWNFVSTMARETNSEIVLPAYPLAPFGRAATVLPHIAELTATAIETADSPVFFMGDSAGGNLAIVATMINRDQGRPLPTGNVLISPWLDLTLPDTDLEGINAPNMSVDNLRKDAHTWRGELSIDHPYVSPVKGALHQLGRIAMFCGTVDVLNPGCRRFAEKAAQSPNTSMQYYEYPGSGHSHTLGTTAAGAHARALVFEYIQNNHK
jgi:acetyl esterase/lipase